MSNVAFILSLQVCYNGTVVPVGMSSIQGDDASVSSLVIGIDLFPNSELYNSG